MTLSDLAAISSLVTSVTVMISIFYLNIQVTQTKKSQQAAIRAGRAQRICETQMGPATEPSLADAVRKGMAGDANLTSTELAQYSWFCRATFHHVEELFYQHFHGQLDESSFRALSGSMRNWFSSPGYRGAWKRLHQAYGAEFAAFVDRLISEAPPSEAGDALAHWREDLAQLRART